MSNLNVKALKQLFPKNTTRRQGGKVDGANRKRVQVMLPPDTLARLDELIEHDQQARSAAVALGVELLCATLDIATSREEAAKVVSALREVAPEEEPRAFVFTSFSWLTELADQP